MSLEFQIIAALILDALIGDPRWYPHPVRLIGAFAAWLEVVLRKIMPNVKLAGVATAAITVLVSSAAAWSLIMAASMFGEMAATVVSIFVMYTCFAMRDLAGHAMRVYRALAREDMESARREVAMMVGRDTAALDSAGITRACVESVAENLADGVIAPIFFAVIGGPVAAVGYKAASTLDSMFGHKDARYLRFGWASARLDDVANYIPARLCGVFIAVGAAVCGMDAGNSLRIFFRDGSNHESPNSGRPEAAMAGALNVRLGGPVSYDGVETFHEYMGDPVALLEPSHIVSSVKLGVAATALFALFALGIRYITIVIVTNF